MTCPLAAFHLRVILILVGLLATIGIGCDQTPTVDIEQHKKIAGELRDNKLYQAAIDEYQAVLASPALTQPNRGSLCYLVGKIYFEDLKNYNEAAAYYVRARAYDPSGAYQAEASRNLVTSLEKLGRFVDAKRELGALTDIEARPAKLKHGTIPVAILSGDTIWLEELDRQIQLLPAQTQQQMMTPQGKAEFLRQYVGMELVSQAAIREGFDRTPAFTEDLAAMRQRMLVDRFVGEKILKDLVLDSVDVSNYYLANKADRYQEASFETVASQVWQDYYTEKSTAAYLDYLTRLTASEQVRFLDHNLK